MNKKYSQKGLSEKKKARRIYPILIVVGRALGIKHAENVCEAKKETSLRKNKRSGKKLDREKCAYEYISNDKTIRWVVQNQH